jgi:hypothetical protein
VPATHAADRAQAEIPERQTFVVVATVGHVVESEPLVIGDSYGDEDRGRIGSGAAALGDGMGIWGGRGGGAVIGRHRQGNAGNPPGCDPPYGDRGAGAACSGCGIGLRDRVTGSWAPAPPASRAGGARQWGHE